MGQYKKNSDFKLIKKQVKSYNRTRLGKEESIGTYSRGQYIKKDKTISMKLLEQSNKKKSEDIKGIIGKLDDWAKLEPNELDRHLQKYSLEQIKKASNNFLSSQEKGKGKEETIKLIVNKVQKLKTHYQMGPSVSKNIKSDNKKTSINNSSIRSGPYRHIKIKIDPYKYTTKDGKEISVPGYNKKIFIEPSETVDTIRKIRGEERWVEIFKYKNKTYMRVFTDLRKSLEISQNENVKKWVYNKDTMTKTIPDNLAKGFKEIAKDKTEHSIMVDFERGLNQPQRSAIVQGGKNETLKYEDFELYGHTHPNRSEPVPSTGDIRNMKYLEPEFIIAGGTGKMNIINIEDPNTYDRWKSRMSRKGGASHPIRGERFDTLIKKDKYKKLHGQDYYTITKSKEGRDLFFEETGVKIYPYKKKTTIEMKDDPHLEKKMPSVDPYHLKKWQNKK